MRTFQKKPSDEIAAKVGLSRTRFFALFRDQLHTTPQVFRSIVRVEEAMRRVSEGSELTEVAVDLGFSASGNSSRFVKGHMGVYPPIFKRATRGLSTATAFGIPRYSKIKFRSLPSEFPRPILNDISAFVLRC